MHALHRPSSCSMEERREEPQVRTIIGESGEVRERKGRVWGRLASGSGVVASVPEASGGKGRLRVKSE